MSRYSHLYNTAGYVPPSIVRAMEAAIPASGEAIGDWRVNSKTIEGITGQAEAETFVNNKLRNGDFYELMRNKAIYTTSSTITAHAAMNTL